MLRFWQLFVALLLLATLAFTACADAPRTSVTYQNPDTWQFVQGFVTGSGLLVDIRGHPYGENEARLDDTVTSAMRQAVTWSSSANFTTDPAKAASRSMRVVMTFNGAPPGLGSSDQCLGRGEGGGPQADGSVAVVATLCAENDVLSNVQGRIGQTTGVSDPRFAALIRQLTRDLFSRGDFWRKNGGGLHVGGGFGGFAIGTSGILIRVP